VRRHFVRVLERANPRRARAVMPAHRSNIEPISAAIRAIQRTIRLASGWLMSLSNTKQAFRSAR
jgi:hypothetical protein